jgi:hypothetical protein
MPIDSRIALGVQPLQVADPLAQYGQVQNILAAQTQQQAGQLNLAQLQRSADYVNKMQAEIAKNGGPLDIEQAATMMASHPDPNIAMHGIELRKAIQDKKMYQDWIRQQNPNALTTPAAAPAVAPATTAAPASAAPTTSTTTPTEANTFGINDMGGMHPFNFTNQQTTLRSQPSFATTAPVAPQTPTAAMTAENTAPVTNTLAPASAAATAPVANTLAPAPAVKTTPGAAQITQLKKQIAELSLMDYPGAAKDLARKEAELKTLMTPHVVGPSGTLTSASGEVLFQAPAAPTNLSKMQAELDALPANDPRRAQYIGMIQKETQFAPTQLTQLIKERAALPPNDPNRKLYDTVINKTQTEINLQQAHLKLAQDKYAQDYAQGTFKPETIDLMANLLIQTGNIPPLGMGKKAADARAQIMNRAQEISTGTGATPAQAATNMASNKGEYAGSISGQRAIGTQIANTQVAANETNKMIGIAKPYVDKVNPTDYPAVNAVGNYVAKNTGDPNVVGLATSLNAIVNTYARAINPKGVATVSDKNHAREILNAAMSSGQLNEAFNVMQQEMNAALASGPETKANLRNSNAPATPAPTGTGEFKYLGKE